MKERVILYLKYLFVISALAMVSSCHDTPEPTPEPGEEPAKGRLVLVYQVANNNLSSAANDDYKEMLAGVAEGIGEDNHFLVYRHTRSVDPMLVEITPAGVDTLRTYDTDTYSVEISRMAEVINDAKEYANAEQTGLILWSHGSGWIQDGMTQSGAKRSFGDDGGRRMNTTDLAIAIEQAGCVDWIYFDCCYMMSVETLYELRNSARLFVGSVTELQVPGMPYDLNMKYFFAPGEADLTGAAQSTFDYYQDRIAANPDDLNNNYCTMSVVKASALTELARATKLIYEKAPSSLPSGFTAQMYSNYVSQTSCSYFDFGQYAEAMAGSGEDLAVFNAAMSEAVLYAVATPYLRNTPIEHHSGLSTYILRTETSHSTKNYDRLTWYRDVASAIKFQ